MTITATDPVNRYVGNDSTDTYAYGFKVFAAADVKVVEIDDEDVSTTHVLNVGYTLTGVGDAGGGNVVLTGGNLADGHELVISRAMALAQTAELREQGPYFRIVEAALDRLVAMIQQLWRGGRGLRLPDAETATDALVTLPTDRASSHLAFDADKNPIASTGTPEVPVSAFMATVLDDATADAALTTLGAGATGKAILATANQASARDAIGGLTKVVTNLAALKALTGTDLAGTVVMRGRTTAGDGGGGDFDWIAADASTADDVAVVAPTAGGGRFKRRFSGVIDVRWYGAVGDGVTNDTSALQSAAAACASSGRPLYIPVGTFLVNAQITVATGLTIVGEGRSSVIKCAAGSTFNVFANATDTPAHRVTIRRVCVDGSLNYPASSQVYRGDVGIVRNTAVLLRGAALSGRTDPDFSDITVEDCFFIGMSAYGIRVQGLNCYNINVKRNTLIQGAYDGKPIFVTTEPGYAAAQRCRQVRVSGNTLLENGPQVWYDASKEDYCASVDGIHLDGVIDSEVDTNTVYKAAGIGIRIEESSRVAVTGNSVSESGQEGIVCYKTTYDCTVSGNVVSGWGRTPQAFCVRNYSGTYVVAREFMRAAGPTLPANPTASVYFVTWPYTLDGVNSATIQAYSASDYYTTGPLGILPFRGYAAIGVSSQSERITVVGNTCRGRADSVDGGGDYNYACDWGYTPIHPVNDAVESGLGCVIADNSFSNVIDHPIYHPRYMDTNAARGLLGVSVYDSNNAAGSDIYHTNKLDGCVLGTWTPSITLGGGSAVFDAAYDTAAYSKIGRQVTVTGELRLTSVSTPSGSVAIGNLPFPVINLGDRAEYAEQAIRMSVVTGTMLGQVFANFAATASQFTLAAINDNASASDIGANLQAGTRFIFSLTYLTDQ